MNIEKEYNQLKESAKLAADASFKLSEQVYNLKAENERLREEIEIRDNLSEKFRKEALSWANIANEYQKDKTKLLKTLQEIKKYLNGHKIADEVRIKCVIDLITKAEEV